MSKCKGCCSRIVIALFIAACSTATAHADTDLERKVKAAFIYNFAKFIDWPAATTADSSQFVICIAGQNDLGDVISESLENKQIRNRTIRVRDIGWSVEQLDGCHMLYVNGSHSPGVGRLLRATNRKPILTIGESDYFSAQGGIIQFLLVDDKVRFTINQSAADSVGLTVSAKLLDVSYKVLRNQSKLGNSLPGKGHVQLS